jgi:AcrR family transcriptional regulator
LVAIEAARCAGRGRKRVGTDDDRRRQLLDTAERVFLDGGYHATTMDQIARGAGMSKRTLYQVFASKAELFGALLSDRFLPLTVAAEDDDRPLAASLGDLLRRMAEFCLAPRQVALLRLMIAEAPLSRDMADALAKLGLGRGNGVLERWLARRVERGTLKLQSVPEAANALYFMAVGEALLHALLRLGEVPGPAEMGARIDAAVRMFMRDASAAPG